MERRCEFSPCRRYRYTLWREWGDELGLFTALGVDPGYTMFICLNPSTADETKDDPTVRRCIAYSKKWGFSAYCMTNIFAYRATDPLEMKRQIDPVGPDNDAWLVRVAEGAGIIIAAWGAHGSHNGRAAEVLAMLPGKKLHYLRRNADGSPAHPLYLPGHCSPELFRRADGVKI